MRRCRHMHEVTVASLYVLQRQAFTKYMSGTDQTEVMSFEAWCSRQMAQQPQFAYWSLVMEFELAVLRFVHSVRTSNFQLYIDSLKNLTPWFFSMDRTHYTRWVPVHIRDMTELEQKSPGVFQDSRNLILVNSP